MGIQEAIKDSTHSKPSYEEEDQLMYKNNLNQSNNGEPLSPMSQYT